MDELRPVEGIGRSRQKPLTLVRFQPFRNSNKLNGVGRQAWALVVDRFESDAVRAANLFGKPPFKLESYSSGEEGSLLNS